jgi:hypothetical protein
MHARGQEGPSIHVGKNIVAHKENRRLIHADDIVVGWFGGPMARRRDDCLQLCEKLAL